MNRPDARRVRPGKETDPQKIATTTSGPILPPTTLHHPKAVLPAYAVFVMRRDEKWRRQLYLSLHAAQKAMDRAELNGVEARCQLVEIVPVPSAPMIVVGGDAR